MFPDRQDDEVAEPGLFLAHDSSLTIAQEGCFHAVIFLKVALSEELLEEEVGPTLEGVKTARLRRQVASMNHQVQALLLGCELLFFTSSVDKILTISCGPADLLALDLEVNYTDVTHVIGHVCRQDHPDHALAQNFLLALREILNEIVIVLQE